MRHIRLFWRPQVTQPRRFIILDISGSLKGNKCFLGLTNILVMVKCWRDFNELMFTSKTLFLWNLLKYWWKSTYLGDQGYVLAEGHQMLPKCQLIIAQWCETSSREAIKRAHSALNSLSKYKRSVPPFCLSWPCLVFLKVCH